MTTPQEVNSICKSVITKSDLSEADQKIAQLIASRMIELIVTDPVITLASITCDDRTKTIAFAIASLLKTCEITIADLG